MKEFGYCRKVDVTYFDENGLGTLGSILNFGKPLKLSGENGDEAVAKLFEKEPFRFTKGEPNVNACVQIYYFSTEEEWDNYDDDSRYFATLEEDERDSYIVSEPDCVSFLVLKGEFPKGIRL